MRTTKVTVLRSLKTEADRYIEKHPEIGVDNFQELADRLLDHLLETFRPNPTRPLTTRERWTTVKLPGEKVERLRRRVLTASSPYGTVDEALRDKLRSLLRGEIKLRR